MVAMALRFRLSLPTSKEMSFLSLAAEMAVAVVMAETADEVEKDFLEWTREFSITLKEWTGYPSIHSLALER
jgi:antibiotic biosynthesis monooxygenase (ABM) superfamily enzyme